jgi:cell shape-determining protein MreC
LLDLLREASFHREAKRDLVGRKAYRLLTSLHDCFGQISEKILTTDRISREMTELEKKLAAMTSRSLNVDKLQADLDAIVKENERLELRLAENP